MTARTITEDEVGERIEAMRRRRPRFRDERVTMAHGAGGKASRALVEGLIVPLLAERRPRAGAARRRGAAAPSAAPGWRSPRTRSSYARSASPAARSASSRSTARSTTSPSPAPGRCRCRPRSSSRRGCRRTCCGRRSPRWRPPPGRPTCRVGHRRHQGGRARQVRLDVHRDDRGRRARARRRARPGAGPARRQGAGLRHDRRPRRGDHAGPRRPRHRGRRTQRHRAAVVAGLGAARRACGDGLHCMRDATRGGVATVLNEIALAAEVGVVIEEDRVPVRPRGRSAPVRSSASTRSTSPTRASSSPSSRRSGPTPLWPPCARCRPARTRRSSGRSGRSRPGRVLGPHRVRRPPDDRHAGRRPAAAHLLIAKGGGQVHERPVQTADRVGTCAEAGVEQTAAGRR